MKDRALRLVAWAAFVAATVSTATFLVPLTRKPPIGSSGAGPIETTSYDYADIAFTVAFWVFAPVGALILSKLPRNKIGWILLGIGFFQAMANGFYEYAEHTLLVDPGSLPAPRLAAVLSQILWAPGLGLVAFLMLLFPNGRFLSARWRWLGIVIGASLIELMIIGATAGTTAEDLTRLLTDEVIGDATLNSMAGVTVMVMFGGIVLSMIGFVVRFRRSEGQERQQLKWLAYPAGCAAVLIVIQFFILELLFQGFSQSEIGRFLELLLNLTALAIPIAVGIAILRHRLFDIDVIISKTLVYGALATVITGFYLGAVIGLGAALGRESNLLLSIAATAVIAIAIQPLRRRLQGLANRLVYGQRVTPYEAMSEFSRQMAAVPTFDEVLPRIAEVAARGVAAAQVRVSISLADGSSRSGEWPAELQMDVTDLTVPIEHRGEVIGEIAVTKQRGETLTSTEEGLISDLAAQAGPTLRNVRLTEELRASRQRLVAAQDSERRRMERDLHDGAQQQLVSMSVKLGVAKSLLWRDLDKTEEVIDQLKAEAGEAVETLRDLARGLFPQVLVDEGLPPAIASHVQKSGLRADIDTNLNGRRFDLENEAAAYFVIREALQNASKHAADKPITVSIEGTDQLLTFEVRDWGPGFDPKKTRAGSGLQNMRDRIEALGGSFEIDSAPGAGTAIRGRVPVREKAAL